MEGASPCLSVKSVFRYPRARPARHVLHWCLTVSLVKPDRETSCRHPRGCSRRDQRCCQPAHWEELPHHSFPRSGEARATGRRRGAHQPRRDKLRAIVELVEAAASYQPAERDLQRAQSPWVSRERRRPRLLLDWYSRTYDSSSSSSSSFLPLDHHFCHPIDPCKRMKLL